MIPTNPYVNKILKYYSDNMGTLIDSQYKVQGYNIVRNKYVYYWRRNQWERGFISEGGLDKVNAIIDVSVDGKTYNIPWDNVLDAKIIEEAADVWKLLDTTLSNEDGILFDLAKDALQQHYVQDFETVEDFAKLTRAPSYSTGTGESFTWLLGELAKIDPERPWPQNFGMVRDCLISEVAYYTSDFFHGDRTESKFKTKQWLKKYTGTSDYSNCIQIVNELQEYFWDPAMVTDKILRDFRTQFPMKDIVYNNSPLLSGRWKFDDEIFDIAETVWHPDLGHVYWIVNEQFDFYVAENILILFAGVFDYNDKNANLNIDDSAVLMPEERYNVLYRVIGRRLDIQYGVDFSLLTLQDIDQQYIQLPLGTLFIDPNEQEPYNGVISTSHFEIGQEYVNVNTQDDNVYLCTGIYQDDDGYFNVNLYDGEDYKYISSFLDNENWERTNDGKGIQIGDRITTIYPHEDVLLLEEGLVLAKWKLEWGRSIVHYSLVGDFTQLNMRTVMWIPDQWLKKVRTDYIWNQKPAKKPENTGKPVETNVDVNQQNLVPNENIVYENTPVNNDITDTINTLNYIDTSNNTQLAPFVTSESNYHRLINGLQANG